MDGGAPDCGALNVGVVFLGHFADLGNPRQQSKAIYPLKEMPLTCRDYRCDGLPKRIRQADRAQKGGLRARPRTAIMRVSKPARPLKCLPDSARCRPDQGARSSDNMPTTS